MNKPAQVIKRPRLVPLMKKIEKDTNDGWCFNCGKWTHKQCEPDARQYTCPKCKKPTVFGASQVLIEGLYSE
jgi:Zn finger protein HypA/HybF involved in hydrogenase expression